MLTQTTAQLPVLDAPLGRRLRRFVRSPKGYLLLALVPLLLFAAPGTGRADAAVVTLASVLGAALLELACVRVSRGAWAFPSSALLSGLIVAAVLSAQEPWYVAASAGVLTTASKHLLRAGRVHVFNPAAVGLLAAYFLFGSGQSWWGALPGMPGVACLIVLAAGWVVAGRANKLPAMLAFLGVYAGLFTGAAVAGHPTAVADIFRPPFLNMAVFFAVFMVTDPPTSPVPFPAQAVFGAAVALLSFATYMETHGLYYLLTGLLVANLGYAVWQSLRASRRHPGALTGEYRALASRPGRLAGLGLAAVAGAVVLLLAAGLALSHHTNGATTALARGVTPAGAPARQSASAPAASQAPAAAPAAPHRPAGVAATGNGGKQPLTFQDHFAGSLAQNQGPNGNMLDFDLTGTGERSVRLTMHLVLSASRGRRNRAVENQATLFDAQGTVLCQGQVTQLDESGFSVACGGNDGSANSVELVGTITGGLSSHVEGDLQAAPLSD